MAISTSLININFNNSSNILCKHFIFYHLVIFCMHNCLIGCLKTTVPHLFGFVLEQQHNYNANIVELVEFINNLFLVWDDLCNLISFVNQLIYMGNTLDLWLTL